MKAWRNLELKQRENRKRLDPPDCKTCRKWHFETGHFETPHFGTGHFETGHFETGHIKPDISKPNISKLDVGHFETRNFCTGHFETNTFRNWTFRNSRFRKPTFRSPTFRNWIRHFYNISKLKKTSCNIVEGAQFQRYTTYVTTYNKKMAHICILPVAHICTLIRPVHAL